MALAIDASTPAVATNTVGGTATVTTASFTPPAGSLLLVRWSGNSTTAVNPGAPSITDNLGGHLTYTQTDWQSRADSPTAEGQSATWWAVVGSSTAMTVTVTSGVVAANRQSALHVTVITGQHATPIGAHGKAGSGSAASIAQSYTAQATGGWGFIGVCDWDLKGAQTAGTGCTLTNGGSANVGTDITYGFLRRTTADDVNGNSNTLNVTIPATSTNLSWTYTEVLPDVGGLAAPPAQVIPAAAQRTRIDPVVLTSTIGPPQVIRLPQIAVVQHPRVRPGPPPIALTPPLLPPQAIPAAPITVAAQAQLPPPRQVTVSPAQIPSTTTILPLAVTAVAEQFRPTTVAPIVLTPPSLPQAPAPVSVVPSRAQPALAAVITLVPSPLPQAAAPVVVVTSTWQPRQPQIVLSQPQFPAVVAAVLAPTPTLVAPTFPWPPGPAVRVSPPQLLPPVALPAPLVLVVPAFTRLPRAPVVLVLVGAGASDCHLPRPSGGTTARPTGTTLRPTGTTARPGTGLTLRPDTGDTPNPC